MTTPQAPRAGRSAPRVPFAACARRLLLDRAQGAQRRAERLTALEYRLEQVAVLLDPRQRLAHAEVAGPHLLAELLPAERRRHRRPRLRPHRVGGRDRLPVPVLAMVDEDASPLLLEPLGRDEPR